MDENKQIEEIRKVVSCNCNREGIAKRCPERIAEGIYNAGYRKQSDTVREFVGKIKEFIHGFENISQDTDDCLCEYIDELAKKYGVEI